MEGKVAMRKIICHLVLLIKFLSKTYPPVLDRYDHQCGFADYIDRKIKAYEQRKQSVYVLFGHLINIF